MLALGIEGSLQEGRHTDIWLDDTDVGTRILHLLTIFLGQRVGYLLLPFHLILLNDWIHQQRHLVIYERLTCGLRRLDVDDETGRIQFAVAITGSYTSSQRAQHRHCCYQRGLFEFFRSVVGEILKDARQLIIHRSDKRFFLILRVLFLRSVQRCEHLFHLRGHIRRTDTRDGTLDGRDNLVVRESPVGQNSEELLFVEVADETQITAHGVEGRVALTLGRRIAITQFPEQGLNDLLVGDSLVI